MVTSTFVTKAALKAGEGLIEFIEGMRKNGPQSKHIEYIVDIQKKIENIELIEHLNLLENLLTQPKNKKEEIEVICKKIVAEVKAHPLQIKLQQEDILTAENTNLMKFLDEEYPGFKTSVYQTTVPIFAPTNYSKKVEISLKRKLSEKIKDNLYCPETSLQPKRLKNEKNKQETFCPPQKRR